MTSVKFESVMSISVTKYDACGNVVSEEIVRACLHMHVACAHVNATKHYLCNSVA